MDEKQKVAVTDIDMPFRSMVVFMVKWALASVPAAIILFVAYAFMAAFMGSCFAGLTHLG